MDKKQAQGGREHGYWRNKISMQAATRRRHAALRSVAIGGGGA
jgi:hypothetical protein